MGTVEKFTACRHRRSRSVLTFEGTGIALVGHALPDGGRADVYLDGKRVGEIDAWISKGTNDNDAWHRIDLPAALTRCASW